MNPRSGAKPAAHSWRRNRALLWAGGFLAAVAFAILALALVVDVQGYKPRLESAASKALGLDVRILGDIDLEFFPPVGLSITDVEISRGEEDVLRAERIHAGISVLPLLAGRVRFRTLEFVRPVLAVRRTTAGPFDFDRYVSRPLRTAAESMPGILDRIGGISVSGGTASYIARDSAFRAEAERIDLAIRNLVLQGAPGDDPFRNVSFTGTGTIARAAAGGAEVQDVSFGMAAKNGNYEWNPVTLKAFGGAGEGTLWVSLTEATPLVQIRYSLSGSRIERLFSSPGRKRGLPEGTMDLSGNLFLRGESEEEMIGTMSGDVSRKGHGITVPEFDPDALLSRHGAGTQIALERMITLLLPAPPFAGGSREIPGPEPAGEATGENGRVETLVADWAVENGVFEARDVAFSTKKHRVALAGKIDLPNGWFDGVTVALVDGNGCARARRMIEGPFFTPVVSDAPAARGRVHPPDAPAGDGKSAVSGEECEPFYTGSVPPPR